MFAGFERRRIATTETEINLVVGGSGPPLLLLHGYPQTHAMWHKVAPALAERFTVVAPDLRGYGDSGHPPDGEGHLGYSKRATARDQAEVMASLGFARFRLVGHDRGARVAHRLALDHAERVERVVMLDIVPTHEVFARTDKTIATGTFHWFFLIQPEPMPERTIGADPDFWLETLLRRWAGPGHRFDEAAMAEYRRCFRRPEVIHASCEDYRAGASIDLVHDEADMHRRIACPLLALWGEAGRLPSNFDMLGSWRRRADDVRGHGIDCGHFLAEEAPEATLAALLAFLGG